MSSHNDFLIHCIKSSFNAVAMVSHIESHYDGVDCYTIEQNPVPRLWLIWITRSIFQCAEQALGIGVIITH